MPRLEINHENTIMYKIVCNDPNIKDLYVGQTTNFTVRKASHKTRCCFEGGKKYHYKVYQFIRANGGWSNWSMIEIEKFVCTDSNEANKRERFWLETLQATLNYKIPSRSQTEYNKQRQDFIDEYQKNYREDEKNKEKKAVQRTIWYNANKERLLTKSKCECGVVHTFQGRSNHLQTIRHLEFMANPELPQIVIISGLDCPCGGKYRPYNKIRHLKCQNHLAYIQSIESPPLVI